MFTAQRSSFFKRTVNAAAPLAVFWMDRRFESIINGAGLKPEVRAQIYLAHGLIREQFIGRAHLENAAVA